MPRKFKKQKLAKVTRENKAKMRLLKSQEPTEYQKYRTAIYGPDSLEPAEKQGFWVRPSVTSFGSHRPRPLWQSILCDFACLITLGLYKP
jgi:hypothetical protein